MKSRLSRTTVSILVVAIAYWLYAMVAVPFIEPSVHAESSRPLSDREREAARNATHPYHDLLVEHFPPGHWALEKQPKVLESLQTQTTLVVQDIRTRKDGNIELIPCAIIVSPRKCESGRDNGSDAIILEAPEGAVLQFDKIDLTRLEIGNLVSGWLNGPITIRSDMDQPGPHDDLELTTRDVRLAESLISTEHQVRFRLGKHSGQGNQLEIRLLPASGQKKQKNMSIYVGGIQWFELKENVRMDLALEGANLLPGPGGSTDRSGSKRDDATSKLDGQGQPQPPVRISCEGPFHFDLVRRKATFEDKVDVLRRRPNGAGDHLSCQLLTVEFAEKDKQDRPSTPQATSSSSDPRIRLVARRLIAEGDPVTIVSRATDGFGRCQRLEYELAQRKVTLTSNRTVNLSQGPNEIQSPEVSYQPSPHPNGLPTVFAAGPGHLTAVPGKDPSQKLRARWARELQLRPHQGETVLSLFGQPLLTLTDTGSLSADEVHVYFQETPPQADASADSNVVPRGMLATSTTPKVRNVQIQSEPLTGSVERLELWFVPRKAGGAPARGTEPPQDRASGEWRALFGSPTRPDKSYDIGGRQLLVELALEGRELEVTNLTVEGDVRFRETKTVQTDDRPLVVDGDWLRVEDADHPATRVTVTGTPARVSARGMSMSGGNIHLHRGENRLWIDTPGELSLPLKRDLEGNPLTGERRVHVGWQDEMELAGRTIRFDKSVVVRDETSWLKTERLTVRLSSEVRFDTSVDADKIEVAEIACDHGVILENRSLDNDGAQVSWNRMQAHNLWIQQITGKIRAEGPGHVTTVRRGGGNPFGPSATPPATAVTPSPAGESKFQYLRVEFERMVTGNLRQQEITFHGDIRSTYGPVLGWDGVVDVNSPEGLGEEGALLKSDELTVRQRSLGVRTPATSELEASGNVVVESRSFVARANRMSYDESKDLVVLHGTTQTLAWLWREEQEGRPSSGALTIEYWPKTGRAKFNGANHLFLNHIGQ